MNDLHTWLAIFAIVVCSTIGDVLISYGMKKVGDVAELRRRAGTMAMIRRVLCTPAFLIGFAFMVGGFASLLIALGGGDLSLVAPASAGLTMVTNAVAAKFFLNEAVDRRRWAAALLVAVGVVLLQY